MEWRMWKLVKSRKGSLVKVERVRRASATGAVVAMQ
jgi:hypothetical protein